MAERLYLDHNATSPLRPVVRDAMCAAMGLGNPSSVHAEGRAAKAELERARGVVAEAVSAPKEGLIFTGGGTEADNLALNGLVLGPAKVRTLFVSAIEHEAIKAPSQNLYDRGFVKLETIPVHKTGEVDLDWLSQRMSTYDPELEGAFAVCVMAANNETGVIQPVSDIGPIVWPKGGFVVVDAVQAIGKTDLDFNKIGADLLAIAAHKVGGPTGVGALLTKPGIPLATFVRGGGQEQYRRAGTENLSGIVGLAKTVEVASHTDYAALTAVRDKIQRGLPGFVKIWGQTVSRLPNTLCFSAPGFANETQVMVMDLAGIAVSAGSACSSGKVRASDVLTAMGASEDQAKSALRVSLGWDTPVGAADRFVDAWINEYQRISGRAVA